MNHTELFFLRSSEYYILEDILNYSVNNKQYNIENYGYKNGDIGIYSMQKGKIEGAAWVRFNENLQMPELSYIVKDEYKASQEALLKQLFVEVSHSFDTLFIALENSNEIEFLKKLGFVQEDDKDLLICHFEKKSNTSKDFAQEYDKYLTSSYF